MNLTVVIHIEEVSRTKETITFDTYANGEFAGRKTGKRSSMNMGAYESFRKERKPVSYIQESYN